MIASIEAPALGEPLPAHFFEAPVLVLARSLIGKVLLVRSEAGLAGGRIVETEAYRGPKDLAAHSSGGRRTKRTEAMYGPPGHAYMFLLYGRSWAFNVVAGPVEEPHAVLVRALEPTVGLELMAARRGVSASRRELTNGPGKLTHALGLSGQHYGAPLHGGLVPRHEAESSAANFCLKRGDVFLIDGQRGSIGRSPRINIDYAGDWVSRPWRFYERKNRYVSVAPRD